MDSADIRRWRAELAELLGSAAVIAEEVPPPHPAWGRDRSPAGEGRPALVVRPASTDEVQRLVRWARRRRVPLVPAGGRSGYSGGATATGGEAVVAFERLDRILEWLPEIPAVRLQAGVVTGRLQQAAAERGWLYPVDFAACDRSQVGGNVATNAGGVRVIRWGMTRRWVLGLTVVSGAGEVLELGGGLLKDNAGYDLKQLFVGSEGTLGLITEVTLRLTRPVQERTLIALAADELEGLLAILRRSHRLPRPVLAFEMFDGTCQEMMSKVVGQPLFDRSWHFLALLEIETPPPAVLAAWLEALPSGIAHRPAADGAEAERFWRHRLEISDTLAQRHRVHKNDLSVPPRALPTLHRDLTALARQIDLPLTCFGHVGDGNLHVNLLRPDGLEESAFAERCRAFDVESYRRVATLGGSISAEHGLGRLKGEHLPLCRSPAELAAMAAIKQVFDPDGILNPGKVLPG